MRGIYLLDVAGPWLTFRPFCSGDRWWSGPSVHVIIQPVLIDRLLRHPGSYAIPAPTPPRLLRPYFYSDAPKRLLRPFPRAPKGNKFAAVLPHTFVVFPPATRDNTLVELLCFLPRLRASSYQSTPPPLSVSLSLSPTLPPALSYNLPFSALLPPVPPPTALVISVPMMRTNLEGACPAPQQGTVLAIILL